MHVVMLLMKLATLSVTMHILVMTSMETIKVKLRHLKAIKRTLEMECRTMREVGTSSVIEEKHIVIVVIVEEAMGAENIVEISIASRAIERSFSKLVILSSHIFVAQYLICYAHKNSSLVLIGRLSHR